MSEAANRSFEAHEHVGVEHTDGHPRRAALAIGILAAVLAICEVGERSNQTAYLAHHIKASDEYAFYQAHMLRVVVLNQSAASLTALSQSPSADAAAKSAREDAQKQIDDNDHGSGANQILARARAHDHDGELSLHRYEWFEIIASALQIAIVLASVSVVTRLTRLLLASVVVGGVAATAAVMVGIGVL